MTVNPAKREPEFDPAEWGPEAAHWPEMVAALVDFGLSRQTALRLAGMIHVTQDMVNRWVAYCKLRGRQSQHGSNAFLIIRLNRNDIPPPSWGALRRLEKKLQAASDDQRSRQVAKNEAGV